MRPEPLDPPRLPSRPRPTAPVTRTPALERELARRRALARRRRQARIRRNRLVAASVVSLLVLALGLGLSSGGGPRAVGSRTPAPATVRLTPLLARRLVVPGAPAALPWPPGGQGAVAVRGIGVMGASPHERAVPVASLTKMMTAYVVLRDHPLAPGAPGPELVLTKADVTTYVRDVQAGDSSVPVAARERLSERQLLEALLVPSADNVADLLAVWDAGSAPAFVGRMNATARVLGLRHTHYADASGVDPRSRSTAADQARLAADLMAQPVVRAIVRHPSLPFPVAGTITNYNPALGTDGIVGVKSGFTSQAQGCLATAAYRRVGGRSVLVVSVALGQPDGLYGAARADERLLGAATKALVAVPPAPASRAIAGVSAPWTTARTTARAASGGDVAVAWPGLVLARRLVGATTSSRPARRGQSRRVGRVGSLVLEAPWGADGGVPLVARRALPPVPAGWTPPGR